MTLKEAHIIIQQELQSLDSFVNLDFGSKEVDRALNTTLLNMIEDIVSGIDLLRKESKFEEIQQKLDKLDRLYVVDSELTPTLNSSAPNPYYYYDLKTFQTPNKVYHLLQDKSKVRVTCKIDGVNTTVDKIVPNTLVKIASLSNTLENTLSKTKKERPISNYYNGILRVFYDNFTVYRIYIDYIKLPQLISYNSFTKSCNVLNASTTITTASTVDVIVGMSVSGTGIQANTVVAEILSDTTFRISIAATATNNNVTVTLNANAGAEMPLSESGNIELVNKTISYLMKVSEQNQQKIVNLENK